MDFKRGGFSSSDSSKKGVPFGEAGLPPDAVKRSIDGILDVIGYGRDVKGLDFSEKERLIASNLALNDLNNLHTHIVKSTASSSGAKTSEGGLCVAEIKSSSIAKWAVDAVHLLTESPDHTIMTVMVLSLGMIVLHERFVELKKNDK
jgi:hypothetical protein